MVLPEALLLGQIWARWLGRPFLCGGSSVVAFATAFGESAFALELQALETQLSGLLVLVILPSGLHFLEMVLLGLRPLEAESEVCDWMHGQARQAV